MEPRGRGRARGRARGGQGDSNGRGADARGRGGRGAGHPGVQPQPGGAPRPQSTPTQSVWQARAQAPMQSAAPSTAWVRAPPSQTVAGRGSRIGGGDAPDPASSYRRGVTGAGDGQQCETTASRDDTKQRSGGNGGVRGRSLRHDILISKPKELATKQGKVGQRILLKSNYFQLVETGKWVLYQYRVDFSEDIDSTVEKKHYVFQALKDTVTGYMFDGTVLYSHFRLNPEPMEKFVHKRNAEGTLRISLRLIGDIGWGDPHYLQVFNLVIRRCLISMHLDLINRNYYDSREKKNLTEHKIEIWPGYFTSIRQHEATLLMNCELKFKLMRIDTAYDTLMSLGDSYNLNTFKELVVNTVILTYYNNKTYKIDDVDQSKNPLSTFKRSDGTEISYRDYYMQRYNIAIKDMNQPLLVSLRKPRELRAGLDEFLFLVPELCQLTGLSEHQRENIQVTKRVSDYTRVEPHERIDEIEKFSHRLRTTEAAVNYLQHWGMKLSNKLIKLDGRVLPKEKIYTGRGPCEPDEKADWSRFLRDFKFSVGADPPYLEVICPERLRTDTQFFMSNLRKAAEGMSWRFGDIKFRTITNSSSTGYVNAIQSVESLKPSMIICILFKNAPDLYSTIKTYCSCHRAIPTQVVLAKNLKPARGGMSICTKVAIQMNCKLGGAPWAVEQPLSNIMVVGYDVCRIPGGRGEAYAGMVASLDKSLTRYYNFVQRHSLDEEFSTSIGTFLTFAIEAYRKINHTYPERILIYRDGVGDGQLRYVYEQEVENIREKLNNVYKGKPYRLGFIVVSKRINTRFFSQQGNPPPGTVVDNVVTLPERYDFFIVSQCVRQGTVTPTSYNILYDGLGLGADHYQRYTYKMCHMYFNWSGTVRVPAPCQYAHKLAFMAAQNLKKPFHSDLATLLFYL